ncbi:rod-determining factor RdfA (plasmid) [Haloarcula salina]|uniref:rod-determining factor RdfA n=1 Tax=Haloarcula salina TaxID=1429914 RepID=UPI003C704A9C
MGRLISVYDLTSPAQYSGSLDDYLVAKWKGKGHHSAVGYRKLTEWFNKHCLQSVYRRHGRSDTKARLDAEYEALRGEDVKPHERQEVLADLESDGIDGERLADDFVSKSTLSRHIRQCLEESKGTQTADTDSSWELDQFEYAGQQYHDRLAEALSSLDSKDRITGATAADLSVRVTLACPECPTRVTLETAIDQGYVCADHLGTPRDGEE